MERGEAASHLERSKDPYWLRTVHFYTTALLLMFLEKESAEGVSLSRGRAKCEGDH